MCNHTAPVNPSNLSDDHYAMSLTGRDYMRSKHPDHQGQAEWGPITPEQKAMAKAVEQFKRRHRVNTYA